MEATKVNWTPAKKANRNLSPKMFKSNSKPNLNSNKPSNEVVEVPVVAVHDTYQNVIGLPSIMQADVELIQEYFENILQSLQLVYDESYNSVMIHMH